VLGRCGQPADRYLEPFQQAFQPIQQLRRLFHPNKQGQSAYAATIESFIRSAISSGAPLTAAGLPADPPPVSTGGGGGGGGGGVPDPTTDYGALNILPLSRPVQRVVRGCVPSGQQVEVQGTATSQAPWSRSPSPRRDRPRRRTALPMCSVQSLPTRPVPSIPM